MNVYFTDWTSFCTSHTSFISHVTACFISSFHAASRFFLPAGLELSGARAGAGAVALHLDPRCPRCLFVSRAVSLVRAEVSTVNKRKMEIRDGEISRDGGGKM